MNHDEYFSVHAHLKINVEPIDNTDVIPSQVDFKHSIPLSFRIANQCGHLDLSIEREVQVLSNEQGHALAKYLHNQNEKINLLLGFILSEQDNPAFRYQTQTFGASGLTFIAKRAFEKNTAVRLKVFLDAPLSAIYCYGRVYGCKEKNGRFAVGITYTRLLDEDRDILIRAALQLQQKQLRQRALDRDN